MSLAFNMLAVTEILSDLVRIPSVNPMGSATLRPEMGESRVTDFLESLLQRLGFATYRQPVLPGRENLIARLDAAKVEAARPLLLFAVHQDTVPVAGMTIPPFTPTVRDGRLYGRGACDVKGGMAAMIVALARLLQDKPPGLPGIVLACTVNEECGFDGVEALPKLWEQKSAFLPRKPDFAVVAEPTELDVVVAHKGVVRWRCHAHGRAAHGAFPERGDNAIYRMSRVLDILERYQKQTIASLASHPLCGCGTLNVGMIAGGVSVNTVPDRCTIEIDRRLAPSETPDAARQHLIDALDKELNLGCLVTHESSFMHGLPLPDTANSDLADRLAAIAHRIAGRGRKLGVPYCTDASTLAAHGVPTVVFGPGSIAQAHTADEWIAVDQLHAAAEIYHELGASMVK